MLKKLKVGTIGEPTSGKLAATQLDGRQGGLVDDGELTQWQALAGG